MSLARSIFTHCSNLSWQPVYGDGATLICPRVSTVMPWFRVCSDGVECACRARTSALARPGGTLDAVTAHSTPPPHAGLIDAVAAVELVRPNRGVLEN